MHWIFDLSSTISAGSHYWVNAVFMKQTMQAVLLTGFGGFEKLEFREDVPVPEPGASQVLIRVAAAGVNNTDINTRLGWYAQAKPGESDDSADIQAEDSAWSGQALEFPRIQGIDVCGEIVAVGAAVDSNRVGERVIVVPMQRSPIPEGIHGAWTLGADGDGGFAEYVVTNSVEAFAVDSGYSDAELASFPCAWSTAENLIEHAEVAEGDNVLVTGASGGVGSAAVALARRRGARVIGVAGRSKHSAVLDHGADSMIPREEPLADHLGAESVDVVIDLVGGDDWASLLDAMKRGGRYACAGAIGGPHVKFDLRTFYLKDLVLKGRTLQERTIFAALVGYIEREEVRPVVSATYPLREIVRAQQDFLAKQFVGKLVLLP